MRRRIFNVHAIDSNSQANGTKMRVQTISKFHAIQWYAECCGVWCEFDAIPPWFWCTRFGNDKPSNYSMNGLYSDALHDFGTFDPLWPLFDRTSSRCNWFQYSAIDNLVRIKMNRPKEPLIKKLNNNNNNNMVRRLKCYDFSFLSFTKGFILFGFSYIQRESVLYIKMNLFSCHKILSRAKCVCSAWQTTEKRNEFPYVIMDDAFRSLSFSLFRLFDTWLLVSFVSILAIHN